MKYDISHRLIEQSLNVNRKFVQKGWGHEEWLVNKDYCGKELYMKKGKRLSLHYHGVKSETFLLVRGEAELKFYDNPELDKFFKTWEDFYKFHSKEIGTLVLRVDDTFDIPVGRRHTLLAFMDTRIFEFSTHHEDEDSIRILKGD